MTKPKPPQPPRSTFAELVAFAEEKRKAAIHPVPPIHSAADSKLAPVDSLLSTPVPVDSHPDEKRLSTASGYRKDKHNNPRETQLNVRISKQLVAHLKMISLAEGKTVKELLEAAIKGWLSTRSVDSSLSTIDSDEVIDDDIVGLYRKWTGRPWTEQDTKAFRTVSHLHPSVIKIGILRSVILSTEPINSFGYCAKTVRAIAPTVKMEQAGSYLRYLEDAANRKPRRWAGK